MKSVDAGAESGVSVRSRMRNLTAKFRSWVVALSSPGLRAHDEEHDLMLEDEQIAYRDIDSPGEKRISLLAGAEQMLADGHTRKVVSTIYGDAITIEAESRLEKSGYSSRL